MELQVVPARWPGSTAPGVSDTRSITLQNSNKGWRGASGPAQGRETGGGGAQNSLGVKTGLGLQLIVHCEVSVCRDRVTVVKVWGLTSVSSLCHWYSWGIHQAAVCTASVSRAGRLHAVGHTQLGPQPL